MTPKPDYKAAIEYMTGKHYHPRGYDDLVL
jgi:hypothetical protein